MIPEGGKTFNPFLALPNPFENKEGEIKVEASVIIQDEFKAPNNPKLKSPLLGNVLLLNGFERTLGLNWSSYFEISKVYGKDTADWVGKEIVYKGMKKLGQGMGHLWCAKI